MIKVLIADDQELIRILGSIESTYGVYACYGNHDIDEKILSGFTFDRSGDRKESDPRMDAFLEEAGINTAIGLIIGFVKSKGYKEVPEAFRNSHMV